METKDFFVDLVFYNYILKCFVLIDLKSGELTHQDIGQMDMYVRLFEDTVKGADDNPTVGIILCTEKDHTVVKYSVLNENRQLIASRYMLYLPTEEALREELERERALVVREQPAQYAVALHVWDGRAHRNRTRLTPIRLASPAIRFAFCRPTREAGLKEEPSR